MAIDFGRFARGVATGYLTEKIRDSRAKDQAIMKDILTAKNQYFNVDKPQFLKELKEQDSNFNLAKNAFNEPIANALAVKGLLTNKSLTTTVLNNLKDNPAAQKAILADVEGTYDQVKTDAIEEFNTKNQGLKEYFSKIPGGLATNLLEVQLPDAGKDIAETGINTGAVMDTPAAEPASGFMMSASNVYNINTHGTERREFDTDFKGIFSNRMTGAPEINVGTDDPRYDLQQFLKDGFEEARDNGYKQGIYQYMTDKYIDTQFKKQGITGYPTGFDTQPEIKTKESDVKGAVPGDGVKFDTSQIGVKEDANINIKSKVPLEGGGVSSPSIVINDLREIIAQISNSTTLSDDEKSKRIDVARSRAKQQIEKMGIDSSKFNF